MKSAAIETMIELMESLPEATQMQLVDHAREYLLEIEDEAHWDAQFARTQEALGRASDQARRDFANGLTTPLKFDDL